MTGWREECQLGAPSTWYQWTLNTRRGKHNGKTYFRCLNIKNVVSFTFLKETSFIKCLLEAKMVRLRSLPILHHFDKLIPRLLIDIRISQPSLNTLTSSGRGREGGDDQVGSVCNYKDNDPPIFTATCRSSRKYFQSRGSWPGSGRKEVNCIRCENWFYLGFNVR